LLVLDVEPNVSRESGNAQTQLAMKRQKRKGLRFGLGSSPL
jgi:hypothetical protein